MKILSLVNKTLNLWNVQVHSRIQTTNRVSKVYFSHQRKLWGYIFIIIDIIVYNRLFGSSTKSAMTRNNNSPRNLFVLDLTSDWMVECTFFFFFYTDGSLKKPVHILLIKSFTHANEYSYTLSIPIVVLGHEYSWVIVLFPLMTEQEVIYSS